MNKTVWPSANLPYVLTYQLSHISLFLLCLGHKKYKRCHVLIDLQVCVGNKELISRSYQRFWLFYFTVVTLYLKCLKKCWSLFASCLFFLCHPNQQTKEFSKCFPCHLLPRRNLCPLTLASISNVVMCLKILYYRFYFILKMFNLSLIFIIANRSLY